MQLRHKPKVKVKVHCRGDTQPNIPTGQSLIPNHLIIRALSQLPDSSEYNRLQKYEEDVTGGPTGQNTSASICHNVELSCKMNGGLTGVERHEGGSMPDENSGLANA